MCYNINDKTQYIRKLCEILRKGLDKNGYGALRSKQASRGNSVFLSYPEFNTGYNARDRCINGTVGYGRFCVINYPALTGNNEMKG